jgi:DNA-binding NarL/FixJ family response regulator
MQPIRILVVDDHAVLRTALRELLESEPDLTVAGEAASGESAVEAALELRPDVVLMDLSMPGCGGLQATRTIASASDVRVLVFSIHAEQDGLLPALHAGASGYLAKTVSPDELLGTIRRVARGDVVLSPAGVRALVAAVTTARIPAGRGRSVRRPSGSLRARADRAG